MATKKSTRKPAHAAPKRPANGKRPPARTSASRPDVRRKKRSQPRDIEALRRRNQITAVILFAVSILLVFLVLIPGDHVWLWMHNVLLGLFGFLSIIWPILLGYISIMIALGKSKKPRAGLKMAMILIIMALLCGTVYIFQFGDVQSETPFGERLGNLYLLGQQVKSAGFFSGLIGSPFVAVLGSVGAKIVSILLLFVIVMVFTGTTLLQLFHTVSKPTRKVKESFQQVRERRQAEDEIWEQEYDHDVQIDIPVDAIPKARGERAARESTKTRNEKLERLQEAFRQPPPTLNPKPEPEPEPEPIPEEAPSPAPLDDEEAFEVSVPEPTRPEPVPEEPEPGSAAAAAAAFMAKTKAAQEAPKPPEPAPEPKEEPEEFHISEDALSGAETAYQFPPLSLLQASEATNHSDITMELQSNGQILVDTLKSFGVQTRILDISRGPAVTRYELQPAAGVKISKITNLSDDIAMNLAASGVRMEAPIPGKAAVGIEVPNKTVSIVRMRELIESDAFVNAQSKLTVALGRDISGQVTVTDLSKMPHMLIAGSTGSGKSVCINSLIVSLLYKAKPDEVKFLMVDPKVVELGIYNGIPHLLVPVVTDPRKAAGALGWAVTEMLNRYKTFADNNVRDLASYNRLVGQGLTRDDGVTLERMPQIVIIIDELADLMMAAPNEVEDSICRLAQMARAAGMHLIIATQRPSVDVITGIIKANIPSRIAFAVSSQVDSRTILDGSGAEKLLGRGDMLFAPVGSPKPVRVQGCFVTDHEIETIVNFVKQSQDSSYSQNVMDEIEKNAVAEKNSKSDDNSEGSSDPMIKEAIQCVVEAGQASTSLLQRRLRLGYARAGRLVDEMEQMGIVGPHEGSKPRQVLITYQQWLEMSMRQNDEANS